MKKSSFVEIYMNDAGDMKMVGVSRSEVSVILSDGQILELYKFTHEVLKYWRDYLLSIGFVVRRQQFSRLAGLNA